VSLPASGYVFDSLAILALGTQGTLLRTLSRFITRATRDEGPPIIIPALCLADAAASRKYLFEYVGNLITMAPPATIMLAPVDLGATADMSVLRDRFPGIDWPVLHAVREAPMPLDPEIPDRTLVTLDRGLYRGLPVGDLDEI